MVEGSGILYALLTMWMVFPNQAAGLQGFPGVNLDLLAVNDLGIGSGWQQSRQNWMPVAVVGQRIRMESSGPCSVETAPFYSAIIPMGCVALSRPALLRANFLPWRLAWHCDIFML